MSDRFHAKPFDESTQTKLEIFQLYTREWLPVFLARARPIRSEIHLFDFFAGPGTDVDGVPGSPLRILDELKKARHHQLQGWGNVQIGVHFFDQDRSKIARLEDTVRPLRSELSELTIEIEARAFEDAFRAMRPVLVSRTAAKLVLIDQFGVDVVSDDVFRQLVSFPTCDILFFISSATLYRFRGHPAILQKIRRPDDYYHVHRAVVDYYRKLIPPSKRYFLGPFSIKKGSNIYGLIFGSANPLGMDKFLQVAWKADEINGEANFDINHDDCGPLFSGVFPPTKLDAFAADLEERVRAGSVTTEADVIQVCFQHGVRRQHAEPVLAKLKAEHVIECQFRVPDIRNLRSARAIHLPRREGRH